LGSVPFGHEIPLRNDRGANIAYILRSSDGTFSFFPRSTPRSGHEWDDDPKSFQTGRLGEIQFAWSDTIWTDDGWLIHVHWSAGNRAWHDDNGDECFSKEIGSGRKASWQNLPDRWTRRHEWRTT